jgi:hypothetical protein
LKVLREGKRGLVLQEKQEGLGLRGVPERRVVGGVAPRGAMVVDRGKGDWVEKSCSDRKDSKNEKSFECCEVEKGLNTEL